MILPIAILSAMPAELVGFPEDEYSDILYTGVGKVNATRAITEHANHLKALNVSVINYGTAAAVNDNAEVGKLYEVTKYVQRDMDVTGLGFMKHQTPFESPNGMVIPYRTEPPSLLFNPIGKNYTCGTGDSFVDNIEDETEYIDVFDMEAYALAKVCSYYYVPFISFKYITDNADEHSVGDWNDNLGKGVIQFKERVLDLLTIEEEF